MLNDFSNAMNINREKNCRTIVIERREEKKRLDIKLKSSSNSLMNV